MFGSPATKPHGRQYGRTRSWFTKPGIRHHALSNTVLMTENGGEGLTTQAPADLIIRNNFSIPLPDLRTLEKQ